MDHTLSLMHWLRAYYLESGRDPENIRHDVLQFAAGLDMLTTSTFGDLAALFAYRCCVRVRDAKIGAVNDNDPLRVDVARFDDPQLSDETQRACMDLGPFEDADFPRVQWRPFALVSRVRVWPREQLTAAVRRGPPFH